MEEQDQLIQQVLNSNNTTALQQPDLHATLAAYINQLILHQFNDLVFLLYRVDVSEQKLKALLKEYPGVQAGDMIATLIIERQLQKIKSRKESLRNNDINEEDRW